MTNKLNVGVIGLGVGEQLAGAFDRHPDCALVALCDKDEAKLASVGAKFPAAKRYAQAEALIDDPSLHVVVVASFDDDHAAQIKRALAAGRHVFSEKPMCLIEDDAVAIRTLLNGNRKLRMSSNTILRRAPRFIALKDEIAAGKLGKIFYAEGDYNYGRLQKLTHGWRSKIANYSVMLGGGIHLVDLLLWLMQSRIVEVSGAGASIAGKAAGVNLGTNDLTVGLLRFENGAIGKAAANFGCVYPHFHRLMLYGTQATYENALPDALRYVTRDPAIPPERVTGEYPGMLKGDLIPSFVDAILGRGAALVTEDDMFAALSVCFAIDRSVASGKPEAVRSI